MICLFSVVVVNSGGVFIFSSVAIEVNTAEGTGEVVTATGLVVSASVEVNIIEYSVDSSVAGIMAWAVEVSFDKTLSVEAVTFKVLSEMLATV